MRDDRAGGGGEAADTQAPAGAVRDVGELGLRLGELREDPFGVAHERLPAGVRLIPLC